MSRSPNGGVIPALSVLAARHALQEALLLFARARGISPQFVASELLDGQVAALIAAARRYHAASRAQAQSAAPPAPQFPARTQALRVRNPSDGTVTDLFPVRQNQPRN